MAVNCGRGSMRASADGRVTCLYAVAFACMSLSVGDVDRSKKVILIAAGSDNYSVLWRPLCEVKIYSSTYFSLSLLHFFKFVAYFDKNSFCKKIKKGIFRRF